MKNTIEFYSDIQGVADAYPIVKPTDVLPNWISMVREDYKQSDKSQSHLYRCPGIFDLFNHGYIVTAWHDLQLQTDGENYGWMVPNDDLKELMGANQLAQIHSHRTVGKYLPRPQHAHPSVLKLNTPWHVIAPRGVKLLITAVPYPDTYDFEALTGILDPGISTEINIQMNWYTPVGTGLIRAGTPLAHIIPISERNLELVVRSKNKQDELWSLKRRYFNAMNFVLNRSKIKSMYERHFHRGKCPFHFWKK